MQHAAFRKLSPEQRLAHLRGSRGERRFHIERKAIDEKARSAWLSIASEAPYPRYWGDEILSLEPGAMRTQRLESGAPLLLGHDTMDQIGVIEEFEIVGKRLRVKARFSKSARGEEIFRDIVDGVRRNTSVGYLIHNLEIIGSNKDTGADVFKVTDWEPLEASIVAVPADPSVGVARNQKSSTYKEPKNMEHEGEGGVESPRAGSVEAERERVNKILAAGQAFKDEALALELIRDPLATVESFKARVLDAQRGRQRPFHTARGGFGSSWDQPQNESVHFGQGAREVIARPKYFEGPDAERRAYVSGMWLRALYGQEDAQRWLGNNRPDIQVRAMSAAVLAQGGALVPIELSSTIIDLKDKYGVFRAEAMVWPMSSDQLRIPQSLTDTGAAFMGESDSIPETDGTWTNIGLSTKKVGSIVRVPSELFEDSVVPLADRVALEIARQFSKTEDGAGFNGDATSTYGGISGLTNIIVDGSHNAAKVALPAGKNKFTDITATDLASLIASLPAYAHENAKFYVSPVGWGNAFFRLMQAVSGNRVESMAGGVPKQYGGYPVVVSPVLPTSTGSLASSVMLLFGDMRRAVAFGDRQQIRVQVLTERYADNDQIGIKATERFDIVARHGCGDNTTAGPMLGLIGTA